MEHREKNGQNEIILNLTSLGKSHQQHFKYIKYESYLENSSKVNLCFRLKGEEFLTKNALFTKLQYLILKVFASVSKMCFIKVWIGNAVEEETLVIKLQTRNLWV